MKLVSVCAAVATTLVLVTVASCAAQSIPLSLSGVTHSLEVKALPGGVYELRCTGDDPYVVCDRVTEPFDHETVFVLAFEYQCADELSGFQVYFGDPFRQGAVYSSGKIEAATEWTPLAANLRSVKNAWDDKVRDFRLDLEGNEGQVMRIRNLRVRAMTADETKREEELRAEEQRKLAEMHKRIDATMIAPANIADTSDMIAATHRLSEGANFTGVAVVGKELDLVSQVREYAQDVQPGTPLPPPMVVGEGAGPDNHTVVRILNRYGLCEVQFLAFPPEVTGGVQVLAGEDAAGTAFIVAAPLTDSTTRQLRVFNSSGNLLREIRIPAHIQPPCAVAVGDFSEESKGDEIAVAPNSCAASTLPIVIFDSAGNELRSFSADLGSEHSGPVMLSRCAGDDGRAQIIVYRKGDSGFCLVDPATGGARRQADGLPETCTGVYQSVQAREPFAATEAEDLFSNLHRLSVDQSSRKLDVGERENLFWFTNAGRFGSVPEGKYTRHSLFAHVRTDFASPKAADPDFTRTDEDYWAGKPFEGWVDSRLKTYDSDPPVCWEPCFTHRWFYGQAQKWASEMDEETGLPKYTLVDRENVTGTYGEFGATKSFVSGSYAPGLAAVEAFYVLPQRVFLRGLMERFRRNPEHFVAVEPNHEMEINAESSTTHGDYNPYMIRAFYTYLLSLYGSLDEINRVFGTPWTADRFDAPRDVERGPWDAYSTENPYYMVWMRFMNYVIYRVVAGTYREALLAGFPPEAIKCHQIPDHYAIASLAAFSRPAQRVTPIDWNLNAGVGYGCTKYGVWFNQEHNCVQGPHSSGFDAMVIGEYQSLHPDANIAFQQLQYMRDNGVQFIHCMNWPQSHDKGYNDSLAQALERLVAEDKPRPGLTGGTGQVRPVRDGDRAYDVVSVGVNDHNTGLIKSIDADGDWNGAVYVVPFHSHVDIETVVKRDTAALAARPMSFGPFESIDAGNLIELSFFAKTRSASGGNVSLRVHHHGVELPGLRITAPVGDEWEHVRLLVRVQIDTDDLRIELGSGDAGTWLTENVLLRDLTVVRHSERTTKLKKGVFSGERHKGGVTFDVMPVRAASETN